MECHRLALNWKSARHCRAKAKSLSFINDDPLDCGSIDLSNILFAWEKRDY